MLRSRIVLSCLSVVSVLSLSACMSLTPVAQSPTRVPVVFAPAPGYMSHEYVTVKGCHHHHYKSCHYGCGKVMVGRGYYGCTSYIPAYQSNDRVCAKWEWMPSTCGAMYK